MGDFEWTTHPEAEAIVHDSLQRAIDRSAALAMLAARLERETSTILTDWVDHVGDAFDLAELGAAGYAPTGLPGDVWRHPGAQLPALVPAATTTVAVRVDDAAAFAQAQRAAGPVEGSPLSELRGVEISDDGGVRLVGVERRSWSAGIHSTNLAASDLALAVEARDMWLRRDRHLPRGRGDGRRRRRSPPAMVQMVGPDLATSYAMEGERALLAAAQPGGAGAARPPGPPRHGLGESGPSHVSQLPAGVRRSHGVLRDVGVHRARAVLRRRRGGMGRSGAGAGRSGDRGVRGCRSGSAGTRSRLRRDAPGTVGEDEHRRAVVRAPRRVAAVGGNASPGGPVRLRSAP